VRPFNDLKEAAAWVHGQGLDTGAVAVYVFSNARRHRFDAIMINHGTTKQVERYIDSGE